MSFIENVNKYVLSLEQDVTATQPQQQDATQPPVTQAVAIPKPPATGEAGPKSVAPEGYVEMVRLLAKALVMNVPPESIDQLFSQEVTSENAGEIAQGLQALIKTTGNFSDNPERVENKHFLQFYNSINENNFYKKFKQIVTIMKKYSNDIDIN